MQEERAGETGEPLDEDLVQEQTERAAAEAGAIGGSGGGESPDEAQRPVVEGGGGEAEGFEQAEEALREQAEHGEGRPADVDAFPAEAEYAGEAHGEPDHAESSEAAGGA